MDIEELRQRIDTVYSAISLALLSKERYNQILGNNDLFSAVFPPGTSFDNPKINFTVEGRGVIYSATKNEILNEHNHNLFKAWQISLGIAGMTSIMEYYLKTKAEEITGKTCKGMGIFYQFSELTKIKLKDYSNYDTLHKYYQVRHITMHNLGRIDQRFIDKTKSEEAEEDPYVYYPHDLQDYNRLIINMAEFIEQRLNINND